MNRWYEQAIPVADCVYDEHVAALAKNREHREILDAVRLSTLRNYVHALGGHLTITAEFDSERITPATS